MKKVKNKPRIHSISGVSEERNVWYTRHDHGLYSEVLKMQSGLQERRRQAAPTLAGASGRGSPGTANGSAAGHTCEPSLHPDDRPSHPMRLPAPHTASRPAGTADGLPVLEYSTGGLHSIYFFFWLLSLCSHLRPSRAERPSGAQGELVLATSWGSRAAGRAAASAH